MDIQNSVVFITGANRGIGKTYVETFLAEGAAKIYLGVRDPASVADFVATDPDKLIPIQLDVTKPEQVKAAAAAAQDTTILVNNAGVLGLGNILDDDSTERARFEMEVNYFGVLDMNRAFAPILKENGGGALVTVASIASHVAFPGLGYVSQGKTRAA